MSADIAANEIDKLRNEIARLNGQTNWVCSCGGTDCKGQQENADLRGTLDAVIEADGRAADLWRAAHPGKDLVIPDRAKLVGWLLEQNAALREKLDAARKHSALVVTFLAQAQVELVETRHHLNKSKEAQP